MDGMGSMLIFLVVIFGMFFLMSIPEKKRLKARQEMLGAIKAGDKVETVARVYGEVVEVSGEDVVILVDSMANAKLRMHREGVARVIKEESSIKTEK